MITSHRKEQPINRGELRGIVNLLHLFSDFTVLTIFLGIYELTKFDFERFVTVEEITTITKLSEEDVKKY